MNYVGIDIGSTASKVVALRDKNIEFILPTGWSSKETVDEIKNRLLSYEIDVCDDNTKVVATGYGRISVDFADKIIIGRLFSSRILRVALIPSSLGIITSIIRRSTCSFFNV